MSNLLNKDFFQSPVSFFLILETLNEIWRILKIFSYGDIIEQNFQNSLKSRFKSSGWEKMTPLNFQGCVLHWMNLVSTTDLHTNSYILATVLHETSFITRA